MLSSVRVSIHLLRLAKHLQLYSQHWRESFHVVICNNLPFSNAIAGCVSIHILEPPYDASLPGRNCSISLSALPVPTPFLPSPKTADGRPTSSVSRTLASKKYPSQTRRPRPGQPVTTFGRCSSCRPLPDRYASSRRPLLGHRYMRRGWAPGFFHF